MTDTNLSTQSTVRLANAMWRKADQLVPVLSASAGHSVSQAEVIRTALDRGLDLLPSRPDVFTNQSQSAIRMPASYLTRADALMRRFARTLGMPGLRRSDVLREAIALGLQALEEEAKRG